MITMPQRIEQLRTERGLSRPALSAALGFPKNAVEKFEAGRQTPSQEQQEKLAAYFGVSVFYLKGESTDPTQMSDWMDGAFLDVPVPAAPQKPRAAKTSSPAAGQESGTLLDSLLAGKQFQEALRAAVLDALRSPEGQALIIEAIKKERKG